MTLMDQPIFPIRQDLWMPTHSWMVVRVKGRDELWHDALHAPRHGALTSQTRVRVHLAWLPLTALILRLRKVQQSLQGCRGMDPAWWLTTSKSNPGIRNWFSIHTLVVPILDLMFWKAR